jgi:hypothetical protein
VNGMTGARRLARPVRFSLASELGADIDGAWWPHTASVARELPELIGVLHAPLGEIVDICINWSATDGPLDLNAIVTGARSIDRPGPRRPRLMVVEGRAACAKLLVVPYMTSQTLGAMVMRCAAGWPPFHSDRSSEILETAHSVLTVARAESAKWTSTMIGGVATKGLAVHALQNLDRAVEV